VRILAIGAHPDDLEYGCAGTLIKHAQRGDQVFLALVTDGSQGGEGTLRREEQWAAAKIVGAEDVFFLGYADTEFECNRESIMKIEAIVKQTKADSVYTHYVEDTHQDHREIANAVVVAARSVPNLLFFEGLSSRDFNPTVFTNIGTVIHQKLATLQAHSSQVSKTNIESMTIVDIAQSAANFRGIQGRVTYAEGFVSMRHFMMLEGENE